MTRCFLAMQLLTHSNTNVSAGEFMHQLAVCCRSACLHKHKTMKAMRMREDSRELSAHVEIDDACLGDE